MILWHGIYGIRKTLFLNVNTHKERILSYAKNWSISRWTYRQDNYFRNKTGNKGKVGGWGRVQYGKNSYIGISLNDFSHLSSSFVSKSFDDVSYVTMSYSNIISNLQNNLQALTNSFLQNNLLT